jgi:hypothetical protein
MRVKFDDKKFMKDMNNIIEYSYGFLEGIQIGKKELYSGLGPEISELAAQYVDINAKINPQLLHHVYEWYQTGSPKSRLFDIDYTISNVGITFNTKLKQSTSIQQGSNEPFAEKAMIMENGIGVTIKPKKAESLRFETNGEIVYTRNEVFVENPGGQTQQQFEKIIDEFFGTYFKQSFLKISGLDKHFKNASVYKKNIKAGKRGGRNVGKSTAIKWVASAGRLA